MPLNYNRIRTTTTAYGPYKMTENENELKKRNNTVRKVFNAKGIPRNMGNKEILGRVKLHNNLMLKHQGGYTSKILALKNEDVIRYIKYMTDYFGVKGVKNKTRPIIGHRNNRNRSWTPHYIRNLMYNYRRTSRGGIAMGLRGSAIREDPAAVRVLKKRTAFLKKMLKINPNSWSNISYDRLPRNMQNKIQYPPSRKKVFKYMIKEFPLPLYPNAVVRTEKSTSSVLGKRKRSPSPTSIKTTSPKRTRTNR